MSEVKSRPILFSGPMVNAILDGRKTQTRRIIKPQPKGFAGGVHPSHTPKHPAPYLDAYCGEPKTPANPRGMSDMWCWWTEDDRMGPEVGRCPYGAPGDELWVRETWRAAVALDGKSPTQIADAAMDANYRHPWCPIRYEADGGKVNAGTLEDLEDFGAAWGKTRASIHMPRWASRITLTVTNTRIERLQDIDDADAIAEGAQCAGVPTSLTNRGAFIRLWISINGRGSWDEDPWVWVVEFERQVKP